MSGRLFLCALFCCAASVVVIGATPSSVAAQSTLERLEQQIRQRPNDAGAADAAAVSKPATSGRNESEPGYLGLVADDRTDRGRGVRVLTVQPGSPAEKAGFQPQDLIVGMIGVRVRQMAEMSEMLESFRPGETLDFEIVREGKHREIRVELARRSTVAAPSAESPETVPLPQGEPMAEPSEPVAGDGSRIERLERRVADLERQVAALERELSALMKK